MKRVAQLLVCLSLVFLVAGPLAAGDKDNKDDAKKTEAKKEAGKQKGKRGAKRPSLAALTEKRLAKAELTEEQTKQIQDLAAQYEPKFAEANKKVAALISPEQRKARREALAQAKKEGKKPSEVITAFKLTPEQGEAQKQLAKVRKEFNGKVMALLTVEQKEKIRPPRKGGAKKPAAGKKGDAAKSAEKKAA